MADPVSLSAATVGVLMTMWSAGVHNAMHHTLEEGQKELLKAMDKRANQKMTNRSMELWVKGFDYVFFDFSDWTVQGLNSRTTSYVVGIPRGKLRVKSNTAEQAIECSGTFDTLTGSDIVWLYDWCRANAPGTTDQQRRFRFEDGKYAGEGSVKTVYKVGGAVIAGALGVFALFGR